MIAQISKTYKFRVYPTEAQRVQLDRDFFAAPLGLQSRPRRKGTRVDTAAV